MTSFPKHSIGNWCLKKKWKKIYQGGFYLAGHVYAKLLKISKNRRKQIRIIASCLSINAFVKKSYLLKFFVSMEEIPE